MPYRLHSLTLDTDNAQAGTPVHIPDIIDAACPTNTEFLAELTGAHSAPTHISISAVRPLITVTTFAIEAALDELGTAGMIIDTGAGPPVRTGVKLNIAQLDDCGETLSGSNHRTLLIERGCIVPQRIVIDNRGDARLDMAIFMLKGSNAILIPADSAALPTLAIASARWTLGDVQVGGSAITDHNNVSVDFGVSVTTEGTQSEPYDTHIAEKRIEPAFNIRGIDPTWFTATTPIPIGGVATTHADSFVYLRKRAQTGSHFVADGTAEHIKLTMAGLSAIDDAARGSAARITESSLVVRGARDGSGNSPLIVTTSSTHPA